MVRAPAQYRFYDLGECGVDIVIFKMSVAQAAHLYFHTTKAEFSYSFSLEPFMAGLELNSSHFYSRIVGRINSYSLRRSSKKSARRKELANVNPSQ
jgi:hypothetical protein